MRLLEAAQKYPEAFKAGYNESVRTDSDPKLAVNPYPEGSPEWEAFGWGWSEHYDDAWNTDMVG
jgi:hypothetical protein